MTSKDVRDIMQLGPAPTGLSSGPPSSKRSGPPVPSTTKRPDGITRELYALIGDNAPSLAMAQPVKPKFKERIKKSSASSSTSSPSSTKRTITKAKTNGEKKWQLIGFTNPCRDRNEQQKKLVLKHWVKDVPKDYRDGTEDTKFGKFNTSSQPFSYTDHEYEVWLKAEEGEGEGRWSKEETDHLFQLAREYDLRFIVMEDRWELNPPRSVDALKDRYYSICRILAEKRPDPPIPTSGGDGVDLVEQKEKLDKQRQETIASFSFDINREIERKNYLRSLLSRTRQQIAEEDFLYVESRRIEQNYHEIVQQRQELLKLLATRDQGVGINVNQPVMQVGMDGTLVQASGSKAGTMGGAMGAAGGVGVGANGGNKKKMLGWEFVGDGNGLPEGWAGEGSKRKATAAQDAANCIERHPAPSVSAPKSNMWPSVALRSSRLQPVKSGVAQKVSIALGELGLSTLLIMPTKGNLEKLDEVQGMLSQMVETKKVVDRIQQELRTWRKKKEILLGGGGGGGGGAGSAAGSQRGTPMAMDEAGAGGSPRVKLEEEESRQRNKRSASVASSTVSTKRARRE
ncbi:Swc4p [Sporobolomyces salmoneus]|uniref:Swc4p n=1 Tax=Sporobolomyces salmoneus TaxID=183962 RepID=UPI00317C9FF4